MAGRPFLFRWGQERGFKFYDSSFASFLFFSVFSSFFSFCEWKCFISSTHHFCLFAESSSHLRWLVIVFPNSNRLFSDILLPSPPPYPLPPPPRKISNWISQFHWNVHSDCYATLTISNVNLLIKAWVRLVWMRRKKVSFERFEYTCSRRELKNTVASFFKKLEFELITNLWRVQIVLRLVFYLHQILKILTGIYLSTLLPLYLAYRVLGSWNSCKH